MVLPVPLVALAGLLVLACSTPDVAAPPAPSSPSRTAPAATWVDAGRGLAVSLEIPPGPYAQGATATATLKFRNTSTAPIRIYFIGPEAFRGFHSSFVLIDRGRPGAPQPDLRPHGYLARESDFPEIAPGATLERTQAVTIVGPSEASELEVRWSYSNEVTAVPGGVQTFDGPTEALFGGAPIPGIWTGATAATARVHLVPPPL